LAALVAAAGLFDFDDVRAKPREGFGARGAGLELGEINDADAVEGGGIRLSHERLFPSRALA
jgi:hypothetical protein